MNNVSLVGRLTKDPELKYSASGVPIVRFTIAVNRQFKKEGQPDADFINCLAFQKAAENLANYQKKGNLISVAGSIQTGSYEKDGQRIFTTDVLTNSIQYLDKRSDTSSNTQNQFNNKSNTNYHSNKNNQYGGYKQQNTSSDEFPF